MKADSRFWDYFIFEHKVKEFGQKTPLEYVIENADLEERDQEILQKIKASHI